MGVLRRGVAWVREPRDPRGSVYGPVLIGTQRSGDMSRLRYGWARRCDGAVRRKRARSLTPDRESDGEEGGDDVGMFSRLTRGAKPLKDDRV